MECNYIVKKDHKLVGKFDSERKLDEWVASNYARNSSNLSKIKKYIKSGEFLFDIQQDAELAIDEMETKLRQRTDRKTEKSKLGYTYDESTDTLVLDTQENTYYKRLISNSSLIHNAGHHLDARKAAVVDSDTEVYEKRLIKNLVEKEFETKRREWIQRNGDSAESIKAFNDTWRDREKEILTKYRIKRRNAQLLGEDIHHLFEYVINEKNGKEAHLIPGYVLTKADQEAVLPTIREIFDNICNRYNFSKSAKFYPELELFSENINEETRCILEKIPELNKPKIEGVFARADLVVVDNGKAYVFDFKTTAEKGVGDWLEMENEKLAENGFWTSTKKLEAMEQVAIECAILETFGIEFGGGEVIPITVNYENDEDGYPKNVLTTKITTDGKSIQQAIDSDTHRNIKGLHLDTTADHWDKTREPERRSSAVRIRNTYMPWARRMVSTIKPLTIQEITHLNEDMQLIKPVKHDEQNKRFNINVNFYLGKDENGKRIGESRIIPLGNSEKDLKKKAEGYNYKMYTSAKVKMKDAEQAGDPIYFKEKDGPEVIEKLQEYCYKLTEALALEFNEFASQLGNIMQIEGRSESQIEEAVSKLLGKDPLRKDFILYHFGKYLKGGWQLYGAMDPDNALVQKGIFVFYKNDIIEIVTLTHDSLKYEHNYGTKRRPIKTILGGMNHTNEDPLNWLSSSNGNYLLMQVMAIISRDPSIYRNGEAKIRNIVAVNPWHRTATWTDTDTLQKNWTALVASSKSKLLAIPKEAFYTATDAAISQAKEILISTTVWDHIQTKFGKLKSEQDIINLIDIIRNKNRRSFNEDGTPNIKDRVGYAVWNLINAMLLNRKLALQQEHDAAKLLEGGIFPTGTHAMPAGSSSSITARTLHEVTSYFVNSYTTLNNERIDAMNKILKTIYDKLDYNPNITTRKKFWGQFFEKEDGRIGKQMRIVSFADTEFWAKYPPEVKMAWMQILNTLAGYKRLKKDENGAYDTSDERYYEIPLSKGSFGDAIRANASTKGIIKGVAAVVKDRVSRTIRTVGDAYFGDEGIYEKERNDSDLLSALGNSYCNYTPEQRETWTKNDAMVFTTDMEEILGSCITAQSISDSSKSYGFLYAGIKTALAVNEVFGGDRLPELKVFVDKYITKMYKGESIMDESLKFAAGALNFVKGVTSKLTLGFNSRAFTREMLVSTYTGWMRSSVGAIAGVSGEDFAYGMQFVFKHAPANINKRDLVGQLNRVFRMAGQSRNELPGANHISDFALRTVDMDQLAYMGTTIPDNYFRVAILIGKMHADGCVEAYSLDEHGMLKYDPHKDKRFSKYLTDGENPTFKTYDPSLGAHNAYLHAKSLWNDYIEAWNIADPGKNYTSPPQAYPPLEIQALNDRAGKLYGNFDEHTKSLMCYEFIGSAILQYKTWLSAKIEQWLKKPGFTNVWQRIHRRNADGKPLYILASTAEEIKNGMPVVQFITEDQITDQMVIENRVSPYITEEGTFTEGMLQSNINFAAAILKLDEQSFLDMWENDPVARANFICSLMDMWGLMLFAGIVKMLFGDEVVNNKSNQNWITQWTYGVLVGFAEDGPIHQVLGSMIGDWNPPSLLTIQRLARTTQSVINGNTSIPKGFVQSFGATRELSGLFGD